MQNPCSFNLLKELRPDREAWNQLEREEGMILTIPIVKSINCTGVDIWMLSGRYKRGADSLDPGVPLDRSFNLAKPL